MLPGFTADVSLPRRGGYSFMLCSPSETRRGVFPAMDCPKCDWWEWILDPAGCALRQAICNPPSPTYPVSCYQQSFCLGFIYTLYCRDVCFDQTTGTTTIQRDWYACGPCFGLW